MNLAVILETEISAPDFSRQSPNVSSKRTAGTTNSINMGLVGTVQALAPLSLTQLFTLAASLLLFYGTALVAYRLFFHPLRKIPGPILARSTYWYEFYEDIILKGHYVKSYPVLHEKYGELWSLC